MIPLCFTAVFAALGGLVAVGLALGAAVAPALLAAPALGAVSLVSGLAAGVMAMRRDG